MTTQHTPGPWLMVKIHSGHYRIRFRDPDTLATVATLDSGVLPAEQMKANAMLIAAAPALLDALIRIHEAMHSVPEYSQEFNGADGWIYMPQGIAQAAINLTKLS